MAMAWWRMVRTRYSADCVAVPKSGLQVLSVSPQPAAPAPAPSIPRAGVTVRLATMAQEFSELAVAWNRLHDEALAANVFTSWTWQYQWWQAYGRAQPLRILTA